MQIIYEKANELLAMNEEFDWKQPNASEAFTEKMKKQDKLLSELTALCREHNTMYGRPFYIPKADGKAVYLVEKINKKTVRLLWVGVGDAWVDDRVGYEGTYPRDLVEKQFSFDDNWHAMVEKRKAEKEGATK